MSIQQEITHAKVTASDYAAAIPGSYHRSRIGMAGKMLEGIDLQGIHAFDFGCGEGVFLRWLSSRGADVTGCDTSPTLISLAPDGAILGDVGILESQAPKSLDLIVALHVLSFITPEERVRFWKSSAKALKPDGLLLHTNPNILSASRKRRGRETPEEVLETMSAHGFQETRRRYFGYQPRIFRWPLLYRATNWGAIAPKLGLRPRGGRVYHSWRMALVPQAWQRTRCVGYYSLARRAD